MPYHCIVPDARNEAQPKNYITHHGTCTETLIFPREHTPRPESGTRTLPTPRSATLGRPGPPDTVPQMDGVEGVKVAEDEVLSKRPSVTKPQLSI